ncbi:hypothetical protein Slin15195_G030660 [Septoria linicola]|uniref:Uncharacterized protein n=1 Tax=Septoria linicola TaxID=215465 RepID=A0A9Q9AI96_9PEZI|nr:hypothetical protein Slin14017_G029680 [Septoria linicola]USW49747.1 hypothetical protein Slin15195_G030660 [Septoria linicola]
MSLSEADWYRALKRKKRLLTEFDHPYLKTVLQQFDRSAAQTVLSEIMHHLDEKENRTDGRYRGSSSREFEDISVLVADIEFVLTLPDGAIPCINFVFDLSMNMEEDDPRYFQIDQTTPNPICKAFDDLVLKAVELVAPLDQEAAYQLFSVIKTERAQYCVHKGTENAYDGSYNLACRLVMSHRRQVARLLSFSVAGHRLPAELVELVEEQYMTRVKYELDRSSISPVGAVIF